MKIARTSLVSALPGGAALANVRTGRICSGTDIRTLAAERADLLVGRGLEHGDLVVIADPDPTEYLISVFACWMAGVTAVAVNPAVSQDEMDNIRQTTGAAIQLDQETLADLGRQATAPVRALGADEPALLLMTSGTTGQPKGIVHSQRTLAARIALNIAYIGRDTMSDTLCMLPIFFGHGLIGNLLTPLFAGCRVHLWPSPDIAEMRGLGPLIDERKIGFMSSVPSMWKIALRMSKRPSTGPERVHIGSAPLSRVLWQEVSDWCGTANIFNMFGMTETANWMGGGKMDGAGGRDGYVGHPWGGRFAVLDSNGQINDAGQGEVLVQTPSLMQGYWKRPDLQESAYVGDWFRTGDTGEINENGELVLNGRLKSEINRGGIKIQAEEVDMLLERHADIVEACAFGIADPIAGETVAAAVVMRPGSVFDAEAIKAWCARYARPDAVPSLLQAVDSIPKNDRGKVVRDDVRKSIGKS